MLRAFVGQLSRDRGYDPSGLMSLNVSPPFSDDSYREPGARAVVFDDMLARVGSVPGVLAVAATTGFPGVRSPALALRPSGLTLGAGGRCWLHSSSADYFRTMRIPIVAGRAFTPADSTGAPKVAMVNELLAQQFRSRSDRPTIPLPTQGGPPELYEIVGVAGDIRLSEQVGYRVFLPLAERPAYWIDLVLRTDERTFSMPAVPRPCAAGVRTC